jgi:hypothetical protein
VVAALAGSAAAPLAGSTGRAVFGILELIVIGSWALMFAVMFGILIAVTVMRGRRVRRRAQAPQAPRTADPDLPARLAEVRRADPHFDERLLLEAAQMICLVMFAAMTTGDERAMRQMAAPSFWLTFFGRYTRTSARDARRQRAARDRQRAARNGPGRPDRPSDRQARLPVDYQATSPELISLQAGPQQRARVRVSFSQLRVVVAPGAAGQVAMATATSLGSLASGLGGAMGQRMTSDNGSTPGVSWLSWAGQYDLTFTRPGGTRTDPGATLASRTCARCGATYRSEFTTVCEHCQAGRPLAWGQWRLTDLTSVG